MLVETPSPHGKCFPELVPLLVFFCFLLFGVPLFSTHRAEHPRGHAKLSPHGRISRTPRFAQAGDAVAITAPSGFNLADSFGNCWHLRRHGVDF